MALRKNFKLLKYEHIIYHFKARDLEIQFFREIIKFRKMQAKQILPNFLTLPDLKGSRRPPKGFSLITFDR